MKEKSLRVIGINLTTFVMRGIVVDAVDLWTQYTFGLW